MGLTSHPARARSPSWVLQARAPAPRPGPSSAFPLQPALTLRILSQVKVNTSLPSLEFPNSAQSLQGTVQIPSAPTQSLRDLTPSRTAYAPSPPSSAVPTGTGVPRTGKAPAQSVGTLPTEGTVEGTGRTPPPLLWTLTSLLSPGPASSLLLTSRDETPYSDRRSSIPAPGRPSLSFCDPTN